MRVGIDDLQEFADGRYSRHRFVALPLEARAHPEYRPMILGAHIGCLGDRVLMDNAAIIPLRTNFEYLDALPGNAIADVEVGTNVRRRPTLREEGIHRFLDALHVQIVECHFSLVQVRDGVQLRQQIRQAGLNRDITRQMTRQCVVEGVRCKQRTRVLAQEAAQFGRTL